MSAGHQIGLRRVKHPNIPNCVLILKPEHQALSETLHCEPEGCLVLWCAAIEQKPQAFTFFWLQAIPNSLDKTYRLDIGSPLEQPYPKRTWPVTRSWLNLYRILYVPSPVSLG